jgi:hypothetical protein
MRNAGETEATNSDHAGTSKNLVRIAISSNWSRCMIDEISGGKTRWASGDFSSLFADVG